MSLDEQLVAAHERRDLAALVTLYRQAADDAQDETAQGFYLTHAYIFALEAGCASATELRARLQNMGREPRP